VIDEDDDDAVEYRADHIELDELERITAETEFYSGVVKKLMSRGSKVIVGPRGVGKTHHMRIAYKKCISSTNKPLPIYVSFSKYLRLEPLKNQSAIAIQFFHCWILCKILTGLKATLVSLSLPDDQLPVLSAELEWKQVSKFCDQIEKQQKLDWHDDLLESISVSFVTATIERFISTVNRKHCVLLCDDAALVLTQDYMIEFMDVFRALKSVKISPKASVYPNTEFGPRFHLGHDAEPVSCWPSLLDDGYENLFDEIYKKRFKHEIGDNVKSCFIYASFGVPRAFINLVNQFNTSNGTEQKRVNTVIERQAKLITDEYLSQANKQPQFKEYVQAGNALLEEIVKEISLENKKALKHNEKQIILGIKQGAPSRNIDIIIRFLEETGLLQKETTVKHGDNRIYDRYIPHFTLLIEEGAFQVGRSGYVSTFKDSISCKRKKHPLRKKSFHEFDKTGILDGVSLDLPKCSNCDQPRISENQKFCMNCGVELINRSTFETLIETEVENLPLTDWQKAKIKDETKVKTIGDIVMHTNPGQELMKAKGIGKYKASKVISDATKWMDEYLS